MTHLDMITEMQALISELTAAANRSQIRAEYIALSAATARAQRVAAALEAPQPN